MQACPKMQAVITQLAQKHKVDIGAVGARMQLEMAGFDRLCVERTGETRISVAHYFESGGYLIPEPDVLFFIEQSGRWIPIEITQSMTGLQQYAQLSDDGMQFVAYNQKRQAALARFCEQWAKNLREQGWLQHGDKHALSGNYLFSLGQIVATPGVLEALEKTGQTPNEFIKRHVSGDWGSLDAFDVEQNNAALVNGGRLLSAYNLSDGTRIWIITESDCSVTTALLPSEY